MARDIELNGGDEFDAGGQDRRCRFAVGILRGGQRADMRLLVGELGGLFRGELAGLGFMGEGLSDAGAVRRIPSQLPKSAGEGLSRYRNRAPYDRERLATAAAGTEVSAGGFPGRNRLLFVNLTQYPSKTPAYRGARERTRTFTPYGTRS